MKFSEMNWERELMELTETEAVARLKVANARYRIVRRDNCEYIVTEEYVPSRVNLTIVQGKVFEVTMG
jgi:hypothetical protein